MSSMHGKVYGVFTGNLMRSRMNSIERNRYDEAWGLDYGEPSTIDLFYHADKSDSKIRKLFKGGSHNPSRTEKDEYPMSLKRVLKYQQQLSQDKVLLNIRMKTGKPFSINIVSGVILR